MRRSARPGYVANPGQVHPGDIVLVKGRLSLPFCAYQHSGIVIEVNPDGTPKTIRQKDAPGACVVDLSWEELKKAWVDGPISQVFAAKPIFYGHPEYAGTLPRWE